MAMLKKTFTERFSMKTVEVLHEFLLIFPVDIIDMYVSRLGFDVKIRS